LHRYERVRRSAVEKGVLPFLRAKIGRARAAFTDKQVEKLISLIDVTIIPLLEGLLQLVETAFDSIFEFVEQLSPETAPEKKLRIIDEVRASGEMRAVYSSYVEPLVAELTAAAGKLGAIAMALAKTKGTDETFLARQGGTERVWDEVQDNSSFYRSDIQ
jgi:hypothetical protein